jgi:hypothetical protein
MGLKCVYFTKLSICNACWWVTVIWLHVAIAFIQTVVVLVPAQSWSDIDSSGACSHHDGPKGLNAHISMSLIRVPHWLERR